MRCTRLILSPIRPRRTPQPGKPPRTRRSPCSAAPGRRGARGNPSGPVGSPSRGRSLCRPRNPRTGPSRRRPSYSVPPGRYHPPGPDLRLRAADDHHREHVHALGPQRAEVGQRDLLSLAVGVLHYPHRRIGGALIEQDLLHLPELPVAAFGARVVEREDEVRLRCGPHPLLDDLPGGKEVGEADRAVVVPQRRAEQRSRRLRRRDPGNDHDVNILTRHLKRRGGHRVDARVPARSRCVMRSTYCSSPTTSSALVSAPRARGGIRASSPGPSPTINSLPRTGSLPTATVAIPDFRFSNMSFVPLASTDASATLGVPTASLTTGEGLGTSSVESSAAAWNRSGTSSSSAASSNPASSDFASTLAREATLFFESPASARELWRRSRISPLPTPRLHPTPATSEGGR